MSDLDRHIIQWVQMQLAKIIKTPEPVEPRLAEQKRIARKEAIGRFIIMLSDHQLVTGLAVMISSAANQASLTGYEFSTTSGLPFLSFTTHVATLSAMRTDFFPRDPIGNLRIISMTAMVILLIYSLSVGMFTQLDIPVQNVFEGKYRHASRLNTLGNAALFILTLRIYYYPIHRIYFKEHVPVYVAHWLKSVSNWQTDRSERLGISSCLHIDEYKSARRREQLQRIRECRSLLLQWLLTGLYRYRSDEGFLIHIPDVAFTISTGLAIIIYTRRKSVVNLPDGASNMGFGQMMALLLSGLQFLAGAEIYRGKSPTLGYE